MRLFLTVAVFALMTVLAGSAFSQGMAVSPKLQPDKQLVRIAQEYAKAKAAYMHRKSSKTKSAYVISTVRYGTASMTTTALGPKVRYRQALRLYREALKLDPKNVEAKSNMDLIISVYHSMHRPVPQ